MQHVTEICSFLKGSTDSVSFEGMMRRKTLYKAEFINHNAGRWGELWKKHFNKAMI